MGATYNYGLGATAIVEFELSEMSPEQLISLQQDGYIELEFHDGVLVLSDSYQGHSIYLLMGHLEPGSVEDLTHGVMLDPGEEVALMGNSGNSSSAHLHVEMAINRSGIEDTDGENISIFFWNTIAAREGPGDPGLRINPFNLFDCYFPSLHGPLAGSQE
ncbi:MAG: peptidoglycan DD-metalloendopeptidase family protein [Chitinivibrionales bacterium]|nr:peptidoglycan DD-metalloendopeptidase family protein [Chitinivibrionales bacterium]